MHRLRGTVLSVATIAAMLAMLTLSGCSAHKSASLPDLPAEVPLTESVPAAPPQSAMLPAPEALTDVLYRLADPAVPGVEKIALIEGANRADAGTLDKFTAALKDGGYLPLTVDASGITWSDRYPGNAAADVNATSANPDTGGFSLPMEFKPHEGGWQLSRQTAETLLAFGNARTGITPGTPPTR